MFRSQPCRNARFRGIRTFGPGLQLYERHDKRSLPLEKTSNAISQSATVTNFGGSFHSQPHGWSSRSYVTFSTVDSAVRRLIKGTSSNEQAEYYTSFLRALSIRIISVRLCAEVFSLTNCAMPTGALDRNYLGDKNAYL